MIKHASQILWICILALSSLALFAQRFPALESVGRSFLILWVIPLQAAAFFATAFLFWKFQTLSWPNALGVIAIALLTSGAIIYFASQSFVNGQGGEILIAHMGVTILLALGLALFFIGAAILRHQMP